MQRLYSVRFFVVLASFLFLWKCAAPLPSVEGLPCKGTSSEECGELVCASDGFCRLPCPSSGSCPKDRTCEQGACVGLVTEPTPDTAEPVPDAQKPDTKKPDTREKDTKGPDITKPPERFVETSDDTMRDVVPEVKPACQPGQTLPCVPAGADAAKGRCKKGVKSCEKGNWGPCKAFKPKPEQCGGQDSDCDGFINDGTVCTVMGPVETTLDGDDKQARFYFPHSVAHHKGIVFVTEAGANQVRMIEERNNKRIVTTIAGRNLPGFKDGPGEEALFYRPYGVAVDSMGRVFVVDSRNHRIRMLEKYKDKPCGMKPKYSGWCVTTIAGDGVRGSTDSPNPIRFNRPSGIAILNGKLYITDSGNQTVRQLVEGPNGWESSTIIGVAGSTGRGTPNKMLLQGPIGIAADPLANPPTLYIADTRHDRVLVASEAKGVWKVSVFGLAIKPVALARDAATSPVSVFMLRDTKSRIFRLQNTRVDNYTDGGAGFANGALNIARFFFPRGIAHRKGTQFFVADHNNHMVRLVVPGQVSTYAGTIVSGDLPKGNAKDVRIDQPLGVAIHPKTGDAYVSLFRYSHIVKLDKAGNVTPLWSRVFGYQDGPASVARANGPRGLVFNSKGVIYFADERNFAIRKAEFLTKPGTCGNDPAFQGDWCVTTIAGNCDAKRSPRPCLPGTLDGPGNKAGFGSPGHLTLDWNNENVLYVTDTTHHRVRKVERLNKGICPGVAELYTGWCVTTIAGSVSSTPGTLPKDGLGTEATFRWPRGIVMDKSGVLYVADTENNLLRGLVKVKVGEKCNGSAASRDGWCVGLFAGTGARGGGNISLRSATFSYPTALAYDANKNRLYISDFLGQMVRQIDLDKGKISTIAGTDLLWGHRDGRTKAQGGEGVLFNNPGALAVDLQGDLFIADWLNHRVRKLTFAR